MKKIIFPVIIILSVLILSNCEKDEPDPDYVGTWYTFYTAALNDTTLIDVKQIYKFTSNKFTDTYQYKFSNNQYYTVEEYKGTLKVEEDLMNFKITEYGIADISGLTGLPTGNITYYKEGEETFISIFPSLQSRSYRLEFSVDTENDVLNFLYDINGDGDNNDAGEIDEYIKEK